MHSRMVATMVVYLGAESLTYQAIREPEEL